MARTSKTRTTFYLPRLSAVDGTPLGIVLQYLETHPVDLDLLLKEFFIHTFFARAANVLLEESNESNTITLSYVQQEAIKSLFYHRGVMESLCVAAELPRATLALGLGMSEASSSQGTQGRTVTVEDLSRSVAEPNDSSQGKPSRAREG